MWRPRTATSRYRWFDSFFRDFFEPRAPQTVENLGSGVLIDAEGHILTNEHVVGRASRIRISLADGPQLGTDGSEVQHALRNAGACRQHQAVADSSLVSG